MTIPAVLQAGRQEARIGAIDAPASGHQCLRKLAWEAYCVEQVAGGPYFGRTLVCDRTAGLGRIGKAGWVGPAGLV